MTRQPVVFLSALALATLGLAACGGDAEENGEEATSSPTVASEEAPEEEAGDAEEQEDGTSDGGGDSASEEYSDDEPDEDADDGTDDSVGEDDTADSTAADPGPAAEGAVIPAGAVTEPPAEIGEFELMDGSGPAHMYSHTEDSILISLDSNVLSSSYEDLVGEIETDNLPAGTGSCGTNGSGTSITCYQRTEDGVITLTAVPEEISVEGMAVFVNQYADAAGAA